MKYPIDTLQNRLHNLKLGRNLSENEKKENNDRINQLTRSIAILVRHDAKILSTYMLDGVQECKLIAIEDNYMRIEYKDKLQNISIHIYNKDLYRLRKS